MDTNPYFENDILDEVEELTGYEPVLGGKLIEKAVWVDESRCIGWMRNKKDKALNPDMWSRLLDVVDQHDVKFIWVKGHSGHEENEKCDQLANQAARSDDLIIDEGFIE